MVTQVSSEATQPADSVLVTVYARDVFGNPVDSQTFTANWTPVTDPNLSTRFFPADNLAWSHPESGRFDLKPDLIPLGEWSVAVRTTVEGYLIGVVAILVTSAAPSHLFTTYVPPPPVVGADLPTFFIIHARDRFDNVVDAAGFSGAFELDIVGSRTQGSAMLEAGVRDFPVYLEFTTHSSHQRPKGICSQSL